MQRGPDTNTGHGHVWKRPDGVMARCGGPALCKQCQRDYHEYVLNPNPPKEEKTVLPGQGPMIGDTVVYCSRGSKDGVYEPVPRAAIVADIPKFTSEEMNIGPGEPYVSLVVLNPTGFFFHEEAKFSQYLKPGCWSYRSAATARPGSLIYSQDD